MQLSRSKLVRIKYKQTNKQTNRMSVKTTMKKFAYVV